MDLVLKDCGTPMNRIISVMAMHARDRMLWLLTPWIALGGGFGIAWCIAFLVGIAGGHSDGFQTFTGALASIYIVILVTGASAVSGPFSFAVGFGTRRRDYFLGTLAMGSVVNAAWAIVLTLLSLIETNLIPNWGVGLHYFHLPFFSDGSALRQMCWTSNIQCAQSDPNYFSDISPLRQIWVSFALLMFLYLLGVLLGSIYQRFGRTGISILLGVAFPLLTAFLLMSAYWSWWVAISGWLEQQHAATIELWLVPLMACFAIVSYGLLRKAPV